jgi:two-component system chemotaxis response regulator CheB
MSITVLVVDDSSFFCRRVSEILNADPALTVIGQASNGREAIEMVKRLSPDVITMDIDMPVMDGIRAVKAIMAVCPTPIMMFSSLSHEGAELTLSALDAGAVDFLPKQFEDIAQQRSDAILMLQQRVKALARPIHTHRYAHPQAPIVSEVEVDAASLKVLTVNPKRSRPRILVIGASTGGPIALQHILTQLPKDFPVPIVLVQHMPATFTATFAERLNDLCQIEVKEARINDKLIKGVAYLAPGGLQTLVEGSPKSPVIKVLNGGDRTMYKPSIDVTFGSISKVYGDQAIAIVLTGMGADGREGARLLRQSGSEIWSQSEASCVIYGMPQAIEKASLSNDVIPLEQMAKRILLEWNIPTC